LYIAAAGGTTQAAADAFNSALGVSGSSPGAAATPTASASAVAAIVAPSSGPTSTSVSSFLNPNLALPHRLGIQREFFARNAHPHVVTQTIGTLELESNT
jgi:hypothetical protein